MSGILVPNATNSIAVTVSFKPTIQPNIVARSETTAVRRPITSNDAQNVTQPPAIDGGGIQAKNT